MKTALITGAAGFIGQELWRRWSGQYHLIGVDNCIRRGSEMPPLGPEDEFYKADVNDIAALPLPRVDIVVHLAAQVSVTRSVTSPEWDFHVNAAGTFAVARWAQNNLSGPFLYASTNKVFGDLIGVGEPISRHQPLDPKTPYGVSKAVGEMYVRELLPNSYAFRQSCIYGPTQRGDEDQGWVGFFVNQRKRKNPVVIYGDGYQVRDLLHVDDLLSLYDAAAAGSFPFGSYVVGGGSANAVSVLQLADYLGLEFRFAEARPNDQRYFVSLNDDLDWHPSIDWKTGIDLFATASIR